MSQRLPSPLMQFVGFGPDLPPSTPGVFTAVSNVVPTNSGFAGAPTAIAQTAALATVCRGAALTTDISGVRRVFAGTATTMHLLSGSSWTSVGRVGGYTDGGDNIWTFGQFGSATIAANDTNPLQASTGGAAFADIAGAPTAKIVVTSANFVMALNTFDGTYGDQGDRWWCSAINDHTSWTPSVTTQATTGRLIGDGGDITAAARFGLGLVVFKARTMFVSQYVGPPVVWQFDRVPGDVGCVGPRALCDAAGLLVFVGEDNIMAFDGTRPQPIGVGVVREWFQTNINPTYRHKTVCQYEPDSGRVWVYFCSTASSTGIPDMALVWHIASNHFGAATIGVEAALIYASAGATMDGLPGTFDALASAGWDSQYWLAGGRSLAIVGTDHKVSTLTGPCAASSFTTGDLGDDDVATMIRTMRLRYSMLPTTATATGYTKAVSYAGTASAASSGSINDGKFDCRQSARWHSFKCNFTGDTEFVGFSVDSSPAGMR